MERIHGPRPLVGFEVEKVIGISSDGTYQVQWAPAWVSKFHLVGCEHLIQEFLQQTAEKTLQCQQTAQKTLQCQQTAQKTLQCQQTAEKTLLCQQTAEKTLQCQQSEEDQQLHLQVKTQNDSSESNDDSLCENKTTSDPFSVDVEQSTNGVHDDKPDLTSCSYQLSENDASFTDKLNENEQMVEPPTHYIELSEGDGIKHINVKIEDPEETDDVMETYPVFPSDPADQTNEYLSSDDQTASSLHHNNGASDFEQFANNSYTSLPGETNTNNNKKKHVCSICHHGFGRKQSLDIHFRTHTGEKPFECEHCHKRFTQLGNFHKHIVTHTGLKPFQCQVCGRTFSRKYHLERHTLTVHKLPV